MAFGQGQHLRALIETRDALDNEIVEAKLRRDEVEGHIIALADPLAGSVYKRENKVDGTVRFALDDQMFKSVIDKRVTYDSDALQRIAGGLSFEESQRLFKVTFSISETVFKTITDPDVKQRIMDARTVKYAAPKITAEEK